MSANVSDLAKALRIRERDGTLTGEIPPGFDVFGIPHGGFLAGLAGQAVLQGSDSPDIFSMTTHFLKKAELGSMQFELRRIGASRRFTSIHAVGTQNGAVVLSVSALVGDRDTFQGPSWDPEPTWRPTDAELTHPAGTPEAEFHGPAIAARVGLRLDRAHLGFVRGQTGSEARIRAVIDVAEADILTAIVASDVTPPAVWNALGMSGWVPTVELTTHVRARPRPGPMTIEVSTKNVSAGFLEEDAEVRDAEGRLIVQSRQLARFTEAKG